MKKARRVNNRKKAERRHEIVPAAQEIELLSAIRAWAEFYPASELIRNSYVLSRFWAWFCQVRLSPKVHIPVPRFFTVRDP